MTDRELMQQALEALEADEHDMVPDQEGHMVFRKESAITALRERLAQPEQQAPRPDYRDWDYQDQLDEQEKPEQSPLDRMAENARELGLDYEPVDTKVNSEAIPEQISEPVGEIVQAFADLTAVSIPIMPPVGTKLYTTPPRREWVGLTDEERNNLWRNIVGWGDPSHDDEDLMKAIEAKLKEKNGT